MVAQLYVVYAPSGAGKTSLVKALVSRLEGIQLAISHTTRERRQAELEGRDYHFISISKFEAMIAADEFLEHAQVHQHRYGTAQAPVAACLKADQDVLLEIDWQGAQQVKQRIPTALSICILPPSIEALALRLERRGQDKQNVIAQRLATARAEMGHWDEADYVLVNEDFELALTGLVSICTAGRLQINQQAPRLRALVSRLLA